MIAVIFEFTPAAGRFPDYMELAGQLKPELDKAEGFLSLERRSEEHTSELQSQFHLVCRLLLDPPTTEICTLSLHDALPISGRFPDYMELAGQLKPELDKAEGFLSLER